MAMHSLPEQYNVTLPPFPEPSSALSSHPATSRSSDTPADPVANGAATAHADCREGHVVNGAASAYSDSPEERV